MKHTIKLKVIILIIIIPLIKITYDKILTIYYKILIIIMYNKVLITLVYIKIMTIVYIITNNLTK